MYILGISAFYHDSSATLLKDGEIVARGTHEELLQDSNEYKKLAGKLK